MPRRSPDRLIQGRLFGSFSHETDKVGALAGNKEKKKGTHIVPRNTAVYFSKNDQALAWMTQQAAYCDRRSGGRMITIVLKESLPIYRDRKHQTLRPGGIIYIHRSKLVKA